MNKIEIAFLLAFVVLYAVGLIACAFAFYEVKREMLKKKPKRRKKS